MKTHGPNAPAGYAASFMAVRHPGNPSPRTAYVEPDAVMASSMAATDNAPGSRRRGSSTPSDPEVGSTEWRLSYLASTQ
jgi:hypothetical protein